MNRLKIAGLLLAGALFFTGCAKSNFGVAVNEDGDINIIAENAHNGDKGGAGTFTVEDNQQIVVESALDDGGKVKIILKDVSGLGEDASADELTGKGEVWNVVAEGTTTIYGGVPKGDYFVDAEVDGKANGTIKMRAEEIPDPDTWDKQASKEDALAAVGMESFEIPEGAEIRLGAVTAGEYRTHEGAVKVNVAYPAVDMFVYKAAEDINGGDPTFEGNEYANEWTQDIDGITVTCYGNNEGDATKTVWTKDGYSYAIIVHGLGGEIDFGLHAEDLAAVVPGIQ